MSQTVVYPNGQTLTSSALTKDDMNVVVQPLTCAVLGINPPDYSQVRVDWPTQGQPFQSNQFDGCYIRCVPQSDAEYARIRDLQLTQAAPGPPLNQTWTYTAVWRVHWTFYGPNSLRNAKLVNTALFMDYFNEQLAASNLYPVSDPPIPTRVPEEFNAQWWERADFHVDMYEAVTETINTGIATSVEIVVRDSVGVRADFTVT